MKKEITPLLTVICSLCLCTCTVLGADTNLTAAGSGTTFDKEITTGFKTLPTSSPESVPVSDISLPDIVKNTAAAEACQTVLHYVTTFPRTPLGQAFAGTYIGEDNVCVILLSDAADNVLRELYSVGLESEFRTVSAEGSYSENMDLLRQLNGAISGWNRRVLQGKGSEEDLALAPLYPRAEYDVKTNTVRVILTEPEEVLTALERQTDGKPLSEEALALTEKFRQDEALFRNVIFDHADLVFTVGSTANAAVIEY